MSRQQRLRRYAGNTTLCCQSDKLGPLFDRDRISMSPSAHGAHRPRNGFSHGARSAEVANEGSCVTHAPKLPIAICKSSPLCCDMQFMQAQNGGMELQERLRAARQSLFAEAKEAADFMGIPQATYAHHEAGSRRPRPDAIERYARAFKVPVEWLAFGVGTASPRVMSILEHPEMQTVKNATRLGRGRGGSIERFAQPIPTVVPHGGYVSAGGSIDTSSEQTEPGIQYEVQLMVSIPDAHVAYEVVGDSMYPRYFAGELLICRGHEQDPTPYIGKQVAVGTTDGRRHVKILRNGSAPGLYDLESFNAPTIRDVEIAWVAQIAASVPSDGWNRS